MVSQKTYFRFARKYLPQSVRNFFAEQWGRTEDFYVSCQKLRGHGAKPDFLIIGAQKAGTTTLFSAIESCHAVQQSFRKEISFFDRKSHKFSIDWYFANFHKTPATKIKGESTPDYMFSDSAMKRIAAELPDVKLIMILRDPVERAVSHYFHEVRLGREDLSMEDAFRSESARLSLPSIHLKGRAAKFNDSDRKHYFSYLERGYYSKQLDNWFATFSENQILVLTFDDIKYHFCETGEKVGDFLGIDIAGWPSTPLIENKGLDRSVSTEIERFLIEKFAEEKQLLFRKYGIKF